MSIKTKILDAKDVVQVPISIPEWGLETGLFVREMNGKEYLKFTEMLDKYSKGEVVLSAWVAATVLVDETGQNIFTSNEAEALSEKSGAILNRIFETWTEVSKKKEPVTN